MKRAGFRRAGGLRFTGEMIYVAFAIALCSGGLNHLVVDPVGLVDRLQSGQASWLARLLPFPGYLYVAYVMLLSPAHFVKTLNSLGIFLVLTLACVLSSLWSLSPVDTLIRSLILVAATLFAVAISARFDRREVLLIVGLALVIVFLMGMAAFLAAPSIGQHQDKLYPSIRGLFLHKNVAGRTYVIGILVGLSLFYARQFPRFGLFVTACCAAGIAATLSASALINMVTMFALFPILKIYHWKPQVALFLIALLGFAVWLLFYFEVVDLIIESVLGSLGKDTTLTNRTFIWEQLINLLTSGPYWILGYGYEGFWTSPEGAMLTFDPRYFVPGHAHNGLLQTVVALGVLGGALLVYGYLKLLVRKFTLLAKYPDGLCMFDAAFMIFFFITNMTEQSVLSDDGLLWIMFIIVATLRDPVGRASARGGLRLPRPGSPAVPSSLPRA